MIVVLILKLILPVSIMNLKFKLLKKITKMEGTHHFHK